MPLTLDVQSIRAVLFDLDGTLLDTAPDLVAALNATRTQRALPTFEEAEIRPYVSYGADGMIKAAYGETLDKMLHKNIKQELITYYQQHIAHKTSLFNGLDDALIQLEQRQVKWGIVTNKPEYLTTPLLKTLKLSQRASCVVCGDEVEQTKPHPESIYKACELISEAPSNVIYIGDAERDIQAGNAAGNQTIACQYGYIPPTDDISTWQADAIVQEPEQLAQWLKGIGVPAHG